MADYDDQRRSSRAENLRLTRMPSLPPRPGTTGAIPLPPPAQTPPPPPARRRRRGGWVVAGLVLLLVAAGAGVAYRWRSGAIASPAASVPATFPAVEGPEPSETDADQAPVAAAPSPARTSAEPSASAASPTGKPQPSGKANTAGANLALRGVCTASGSESAAWLPRYACDGDPETRWSSAFSDTQWLRADLGRVWQLTGVTLVWERSYGASYRLETSLDGKTWTRLYTTTNGQGGTEEIPAKGAVARFVRLVGVKRISEYGYSLVEFDIR
ncbi:discoidin domain-containing protein [Actinoplanes sp. HUAS TT8]|uniref:discoidin domain-containing protein n=1 Tax=Actinoplanes sp. HUAS TT8 TaxID=3447453 RepID=UPI003F525A3F